MSLLPPPVNVLSLGPKDFVPADMPPPVNVVSLGLKLPLECVPALSILMVSPTEQTSLRRLLPESPRTNFSPTEQTSLRSFPSALSLPSIENILSFGVLPRSTVVMRVMSRSVFFDRPGRLRSIILSVVSFLPPAIVILSVRISPSSAGLTSGLMLFSSSLYSSYSCSFMYSGDVCGYVSSSFASMI